MRTPLQKRQKQKRQKKQKRQNRNDKAFSKAFSPLNKKAKTPLNKSG